MSKTIQFYGPFFTNFSYARITRGLALAMNKISDNYKTFVSGNPDTIDYYPSESDLNKNQEIKNIFKPYGFQSDIVIYNNFPKTITSLNGLDNLPGKIKLMHISWEESVYPKHWVDEINQNIHGVITIAKFVKELLIKSGVKVPIIVANNAVNDDFANAPKTIYPLKTQKAVKLYHNSTGKKRKGVDLLIKAYMESFTIKDDICLVIKTTPTVENSFLEIIAQYKKEDSPEIEVIIKDLSDADMASLQYTVDAAVYPSRAEGFGIPALEAMYMSKPVIVTNYSGFTDFCNKENSYLVDFKLVNTDQTDLINPGAKWAEPDIVDLKNKMKEVYRSLIDQKNNIDSPQSSKIKNISKFAKETADKISWDKSAKQVIEFIDKIYNIAYLKDQNIGVVSWINDETGIAVYTEDTYTHIENSFKNFYYLSNSDISDRSKPDQDNVLRCWSSGESSFDELINVIKEKQLNIIHVQYHSGSMFSIESLDNLVEKLNELKVSAYLTMHAVRGKSFDFIKESKNLNNWNKIFIHNLEDYNYAKESCKNVVLYKHPCEEFKHRDKNILKQSLGLDGYDWIFTVHGLLNKHKNIPEVIKAVSKLRLEYPNILFLALSAVSPNNIYAQGLYEECINLIKAEDMESCSIFIKDFLSDNQIEVLMQCADIMVFAYDDVGESASGSLRKSLASGAATIVSDIPMFNEFKDEVLRLPSNNSEEIYNSFKLLLENKPLRERLIAAAQGYVKENTYDKKVVEMLGEYCNF